MKNIYIENGEITRKDNTIKLIKDGKIKWIPVRKVKEINCMGGCTFTNEFLYLCKQNKISVHLYSFYGRYIGSFYNERINKNGKVLYQQSRYFEDMKVELSKKVISALIQNKLTYLNQYRKKKNLKSKEIYPRIKNLLTLLEEADTVASVMGIEGMSWSYFYEFIKDLYVHEGFEKRNKRPPKDMINSMISFINTLLYNRIETEFSRTDIYTEISFLHSTQQKRNSLVLDISELYKIDITFRIIGYLVKKKMVSVHDFETIEGMCCIKEKAMKIIIKEFETYLQNSYVDRNLNRKITVEHSIKLEAYKLIRCCIEGKSYQPIVISGVDFE